MMTMTPAKQPDANRKVGDVSYYGSTSHTGAPFATLSITSYYPTVTYVSTHISRNDADWGALSDDEFVTEARRILADAAASVLG